MMCACQCVHVLCVSCLVFYAGQCTICSVYLATNNVLCNQIRFKTISNVLYYKAFIYFVTKRI